MNMPVPGGDGPEIVTQEGLLLGAAERIGRIRDGRQAVHLHLSRLKVQNRQDGHIRIALRMLEPMVNAYRGQMFLLTTSDIVFIVKDANLNDVENMIFKLRALFSKDPLTFDDSGDGQDRFCSWYQLEDKTDYENFLAMARAAREEVRKRAKDKDAQRKDPRPIDSKSLAELLEKLQGIDVLQLIRRQASIAIRNETKAGVFFQEYFVSLSELQRALAPDINLLGNRWLFQHLSQTLDLRVLGALAAMPIRTLPAMISLNLNIASLEVRPFENLQAALAGKAALAVELQVLDVLADSRGFYAARDRLREAGHLVVIDGLNDWTMQFMDVAQFDADLYKLTWSPDLAGAEQTGSVAGHLAGLARDKLLLARCDSETAITWGLNQGIQKFQGRYVDSMLAAYTMHACDKAGACTLAQCTARHAVLTGPLRAECGNLAMLDSAPTMVAPRARNRQKEV